MSSDKMPREEIAKLFLAKEQAIRNLIRQKGWSKTKVVESMFDSVEQLQNEGLDNTAHAFMELVVKLSEDR